MAQDPNQPDTAVEDSSPDEPMSYTPGSGTPHWTQNWQIPVLLLGTVMLVMGAILAWPSNIPTNYDDALDSVQAFLRANELESAQSKLQMDQLVMDADEAPDRIRGRYWQLWGDLIYKQIKAQNIASRTNLNKVVSHYARSDTYDFPFDGEHLSRWAQTLVQLNRMDEALAKIDQVKLVDRNLKWQLIQQIINQQIAQRKDSADDLVKWYDAFFAELQYETDVKRRREAQVWGVQRYAQLLMQTKDVSRVVD